MSSMLDTLSLEEEVKPQSISGYAADKELLDTEGDLDPH